MRALMFAALTALLFATSFAQEELDSKRLKLAVERYVDPLTSPKERDAMLKELTKYPAADVARQLKNPLKSKKGHRDHALDLAVNLRLRGLFSSVERALEEVPDKIAALGLASNDKGAVQTLIEAWEKADTKGELFAALHKAFTSWGIDLEQLAEIRRVTCKASQDSIRIAGGLEIIEYQTGRKAESAADLAGKWAEWEMAMKHDARRFEISGLDAMLLEGWSTGSAKRMCLNYILDGKAAFKRGGPLAPGMETPAYTVSLWIKASPEFKGTLSFLTVNEGSAIVIGFDAQDGKLTQLMGQGSREQPIKPHAWMKLQWVFKKREDESTGSLSVTLLADSELVNHRIVFEGEITGFEINASAGRLVIGGMDYARN